MTADEFMYGVVMPQGHETNLNVPKFRGPHKSKALSTSLLTRVSLPIVLMLFMAGQAQAQTAFTLDQPSAIPNGLKICDSTDTYCIDIVADLSNPGARLPRTISVAGTGEFEDRQDVSSEHTKLDYAVSSTNSAGGAAFPFRFDALSLIGINSLTDGADDSRIRDSYTFIEGGAWSVDNPASGEIHGASVSINTAASDDVGSFVILDAEGGNDLNDIGSFTIATALGAGNGSEVFLNMENGLSDVEDGHNATYTFDTPQQNTASLIVFNSGGRRMGWAYETQLQVNIFVPELTSTKSFGTPVANADGTFSVPVTILVENTGETLASPIQIRDQLDATSNFGSAFQSVTVAPSITVTDDGNADTAVAPSLNASTYDGAAQPLLLSGSDGLLGIDDTLEVNFTVLLDPDAPGAPATLQNLATVSGTGPLGEMLVDETTPPGASSSGPTPLTLPEVSPEPSLSMEKVADNPGSYSPGDVVTYTYTVTNDGNVIIRDVAISDTHNGSDPAPVPGNEALLTDAAPTGDSTDATTDNSWDVLGPGDTLTFTGTYTITQTDAENL